MGDVVFENLEQRTLLAGVGDMYVVPTNPRLSLDLDASWKFLRSDAASAQLPLFNDSSWSSISIPHTWNSLDGQDGGADYYRGIGWYRKSVTVPSTFLGKSIFLQFEGSSLATDVYVDGTLIGSHSGAFAAFNFDVSLPLAPGSHLIAVKVTNSKSISSTVPPKDGDFSIDGGIYRDVSLIGMDKRHVAVNDFASPGVQFSTPTVSNAQATAQIKTKLQNASASSKTMVVTTRVVDASGIIVAQAQNSQTLASGAAFDLTQNTTISNPHLWNGRSDPYLHELYIEVRDGSTNQLYDLVHQRVGIRSYQISPTQGFLLNGQPYDLHGVNAHQDRLSKGWAISDADIQQDMSLILEVGATMLRTAHYQQNQLVYDLADQNGLIIWVEAPVVNSAAPELATSAQQQLRELIRQNFNHPSIIVWGLYNEIVDDLNGQTMVSTLNALAHSEDPTRLTTGASNHDPLATLESIPDTVGLNRYHGWYYGVPSDLGTLLDLDHATNPLLPIGISEFGAGASIYQHVQNPANIPAWGYWHPEEYQNQIHEQTWPILATRSYLWTKLIWNMFDFAADQRNEGDTSGRNDKGLITYDRATRKDAFYYYKANWSDDPVLYIASRTWTQRTIATNDVKVYSNLDSVELFINGVSKGMMSGDAYHVFTIPTIELSPGNNTVQVVGMRNGQQYTDSVVWNYSPSPYLIAGEGSIKINFGPSDGGVMPPGYALDSGAVFGTRSNGKKYGWNSSNTSSTRRRNLNPDSRYDTLIALQLNGNHTWEYELASGTYDVYLAAGDPAYIDSVQSFAVEGKLVSEQDGLDIQDDYTVRVTVTDGRLTIAPGLGGGNTKLQFVEISPITDSTSPTVAASAFAFETEHSVAVQFSEAMNSVSIDTPDLVVESESANQKFAPASVSYDATSKTATFRFAGDLPDGNYHAILLADSVADAAGNVLTHSYRSASFFAMAADANRDRAVNTQDFNLLAAHFGSTTAIFSQGDFNRDAQVDSTDFSLFLQQYGKILA